jgi:hypothetical protein
MGKKSGSGFWMNIPDHFHESLKKSFFGLKTLKFFDADRDPGSGMEKFGSGIRDKHAGSATLPAPTVSHFMFLC